MSTKFPDSWAVLMDKGYQGTQQYIRAIIPKKNPMAKWYQSKMQVGIQWFQVIILSLKTFLVISWSFGELSYLNSGGAKKVMMFYSAFLWHWLVIIFLLTLSVTRKMQLTTPSTIIITTWSVKNCYKTRDDTNKYCKKQCKRIEQDIGISDNDSFINSEDSW